jgi:hypothetical protein
VCVETKYNTFLTFRIGSKWVSPVGAGFPRLIRINLRDSNPVRGGMFIESAHKQYLQLRQERHVRIAAKTGVAPMELGVVMGYHIL